jgi:AraC family transcriptional regulator of adaptative response/methylated-DNA-[protein]-cysteine methyltransferase
MMTAEMKIDQGSAPSLDVGRNSDPAADQSHQASSSDHAGERIQFTIGECWLGSVLVATTDKGICAILFGDDPARLPSDLKDRFSQARLIRGDAALEQLKTQVIDFIEAPQQGLELPLDPHGTDFQQRVWTALREIPAGSTARYSDIATRIGAPKEAYAVGEACAANMIAVAIPCHRVVRKDGTLGGYRGGFKRKLALLRRERALTGGRAVL